MLLLRWRRCQERERQRLHSFSSRDSGPLLRNSSICLSISGELASLNNPDLSSGRADHFPRRLGRDWHHLHDRLACARNDNLFSMLGQFDELGEMGLDVMDVDFHAGKISEIGSAQASLTAVRYHRTHKISGTIPWHN